MIPVRRRQPDGQQSHDRVSTKEHIRTIVDAPHFGRLAGDERSPIAAITRIGFPSQLADNLLRAVGLDACARVALQAGALRLIDRCLLLGQLVARQQQGELGAT